MWFAQVRVADARTARPQPRERSQFNQQKGIECFGFRFCGAAGQPSKDSSSSCHTHTTKNFRFHHRTNTLHHNYSHRQTYVYTQRKNIAAWSHRMVLSSGLNKDQVTCTIFSKMFDCAPRLKNPFAVGCTMGRKVKNLVPFF